MKNQGKVYKIRYIRDTINGSDLSNNNQWTSIQAIDKNGENVALNKNVWSSDDIVNPAYVMDGNLNTFGYIANVGHPVTALIDLGEIREDIAEIKIWHYYKDGRTFKYNKVEVSADNATWFTIFDTDISGTYKETINGHSIKLNTNVINNTNVSINEEGVKVRNGGIAIEDYKGKTVLSANTKGGLDLTGHIIQTDANTGFFSNSYKE
jgi:hypothetical protein